MASEGLVLVLQCEIMEKFSIFGGINGLKLLKKLDLDYIRNLHICTIDQKKHKI